MLGLLLKNANDFNAIGLGIGRSERTIRKLSI
jgi:hypothetical protein